MAGKRRLWLFAAIALSIMVLGTGTANAQEKELTRWKIASLAPKELGWAQQVRELIMPWVREQTNGTVRLKVYFGGLMGNDEDYIRKMAVGQLQGAGLTGFGSTLACEEFSVLSLPFLFNNWEEVDYIKQTMFTNFDYYFKQHGYKLLLWIDQDFDQIYSSKFRFNKLEDFSYSRFQTWYGPIEEAMLESLGATPVHVPPTDALTAYKDGAIDSNIGPALYQVGSMMFRECKYINTMKIRYAPATIIITLDAWNQVPKEYQRQIRRTREDVQTRFCEGVRKDNERSIQGMVDYGLKLVEIRPEDERAIRNRATTVYSDQSGTLYPRQLLMEVQRYLAQFRGEDVVEVAVPEPEPEPESTTVVVVEEPAPQPVQVREPKMTAWERRVHQIRMVQTRLKELGLYPSRIDGIYGPITERGIRTYQKRNDLPVTGQVDEDLLEHMGIE